MRLVRISVLVAVALLVIACDTAGATPPAAKEPIVVQYAGPATYIGGAGSYIVSCDECSASAITNTTCARSSGPMLTTVHNGFTQVGHAVRSANADGTWTITAMVEEGWLYYCEANPVFTVLLPKGGSVTKFP